MAKIITDYQGKMIDLQLSLLDFDNEAPCVKHKGRSKERASYQEAVNSLIIDIDTYLTKINNRKDTMKFSDDYLI